MATSWKFVALGLAVSLGTAVQAAPLTGGLQATPSLVAPVQADQSYRLNELEERVRELNGRVEELTFQILQTQENMRKMQEDYELRFQELEDRQGAAPRDTTNDVAQSEVSDRLGKPEAPSGAQEQASNDQPAGSIDLQRRSLEPRALGTLVFDSEGNVIDSAPTTDAETVLGGLDNPFTDASPGSVEASQFGATPDEVLAVASQAISDRDYPRAETAARAALTAWPDSLIAGETKAVLGESLFWQKRYYEAARIQLDAHKTAPEAASAPDNLLGLALSLAGLNQREVACATYAEVLKQYPDASARLGPRIKDEQAAASCI